MLAAVGMLALSSSALAATSGANQTHDPSRIVESDGLFYFCSTGGGCASSTDGLVWKTTGLRIPIPAWASDYLSGGNQGVWAPDLIVFEGRYYIYYSACGVPAADAPCLIGLYTTPTLDSKSPSYELTDAGKVVSSPHNDATYQFSTIDPGPIIDPAGQLWTSWGSGYGKDQTKTQLWLTRLDDTGLPLASDPGYMPPTAPGYALQTGRKEGSYLHHHGDYYYLFYNTGSCCSGTASDYTIWVARSSSITGPFTGDKTFYASNGDVHGPGHMGIYSSCGVERFTYHYYPTDTSILGENDLSWSSDGWPVAGPASTTPLTPCAGSGGGSGAAGFGGAGGGSGASGTGSGGMSGGAGSPASGGAVSAGADGNAGFSGGAMAGRGSVGSGGSPSTAGSAGAATQGGSTAGPEGGGAPSAGGGSSDVSSADGGTRSNTSTAGAPMSTLIDDNGVPSDSARGCACAVERPAPSTNESTWLGGLSLLAWAGLSRRRRCVRW